MVCSWLGMHTSRLFPHGKALGELHRQASGEDGGLGGRDIVGDPPPPDVLTVAAIDEITGPLVLVAWLTDGTDVDDLFPVRRMDSRLVMSSARSSPSTNIAGRWEWPMKQIL